MNDHDYMTFAITLAQQTQGQTSPNPVVGAVVVKDNQIVGFGAHLKSGEAHAEVHALKMAGSKAHGATVYVTLEPCSHFGKTPPCSNLLIEKNVKRVVIASIDPNPLVAGKGIDRLKKAGIEVETGLLKDEADQLNEVFFHYISSQTPFVTLKSATSLDGKIATRTRESKWITESPARLDVHKYRQQHDAILVGVNTVIMDNPSLTVRLPEGGQNPIRIILDTHLRTPLDSKVINDDLAETWIITGDQVKDKDKEPFIEKRVTLISMPNDTIEIQPLLHMLAKRQVTSLFVEGGAEVNGSFVDSKLVNQFIMYIAPKIIGGKEAPNSIGGKGFSSISDAIPLTVHSVEQVGLDIKIIATAKGDLN